jgi:hypothetical protein
MQIALLHVTACRADTDTANECNKPPGKEQPEKDSDRQKPVANLVRYKPSQVNFVRIRINRKLIRLKPVFYTGGLAHFRSSGRIAAFSRSG